LEQLGLTTISGAKAFRGKLVKQHGGRRDVFRIDAQADNGRNIVLFLKRSWKPYKKDGLASLLRRGRVWSVSRQEWENSRLIAQAGLSAPTLVAYGEETGLAWERFSYFITEAAEGEETLRHFIQTSRDDQQRLRVFEALVRAIRCLHDAGLATPDLFARHIFLAWSEGQPKFCFIDVARLDQRQPLTDRLRARDLAALNLTAPLRFVSLRDRLRFLRVYRGEKHRQLRTLITQRVHRLLRTRRKFSDYMVTESAASSGQRRPAKLG
jgi:tRNA A-37 threonylcarbamoyl transferase component Bud32